jgi:hypothetical protein
VPTGNGEFGFHARVLTRLTDCGPAGRYSNPGRVKLIIFSTDTEIRPVFSQMCIEVSSIIIIIIIIIIILLQMGCPLGGSVNTIQVTYTTK